MDYDAHLHALCNEIIYLVVLANKETLGSAESAAVSLYPNALRLRCCSLRVAIDNLREINLIYPISGHCRPPQATQGMTIEIVISQSLFLLQFQHLH